MRACEGRDDGMKDQEIGFLLPANISSRKHDWGLGKVDGSGGFV